MDNSSVCVPPLPSSGFFSNHPDPIHMPSIKIVPNSNLAKSLAAAQGEFPIIPREKTARIRTKSGAEFSYSYADLADILKVILPILSRHGLNLSQPIVREDGKSYLRTIITHDSGESISDFGIPLNENLSHQEYGSQLTYWRRYGLSTMLAIATDDDTDAEPVAKNKRKEKVQKLDETPDEAQYEEYRKRIKSYGADVKLIGRWMKTYSTVEDLNKLSNKQWESIFRALDDAQETGTLTQLIGA